MVKGGISKPTRGGYVPDVGPLATLDMPQSQSFSPLFLSSSPNNIHTLALVVMPDRP
jgi:hypothetical protein